MPYWNMELVVVDGTEDSLDSAAVDSHPEVPAVVVAAVAVEVVVAVAGNNVVAGHSS